MQHWFKKLKQFLHVFPDSDSEPEDNVHLWEQGWKEHYYKKKFGVPSDDDEFICSLAEQYTRGLCWVLGYYYQVDVCTYMYIVSVASSNLRSFIGKKVVNRKSVRSCTWASIFLFSTLYMYIYIYLYSQNFFPRQLL